MGALGGVVRRRLWLVVLATVVALGAALFYSRHQQEQYQSTAVLLFRPVLLDVELTGVPLQVPSSDSTVESATDVGLVSQQNVRLVAAAQLGAPYTADSLKNQVSISPQDKSNLVGIQATANGPQQAARIANAIAGSYLQITGQQTVSDIHAAETHLRAQISDRTLTRAQRAALRAALIKLAVLASLGPQDVHLVQAAVPPSSNSPSSPKTVRNMVIGGIIGLVIGLALAFGVELSDKRLRRPEDVERETGLPLLATVPRSRRLRRPLRSRPLELQETEPFRRLASHLRHRPGDPKLRSVLVTSAA
ncbi:MAG: Wzz/FepE/Etk N-terminal domain-containing protein, partial [Solirubrobacteraceae bacterium]